MPRIYVQFAGLDQIGTKCKTVASNIDSIRSDLKQVIGKLDWDVRYESNINDTANKICKKLDTYEDILKDYKKFIDDAREKYVELDEYGSQDKGFLDTIKGGISAYIEDWKTGAEIIGNAVSDTISDLREDVESRATELAETIQNGIDAYIENWKTGAEMIKTSLSNCVSALQEDWEAKGTSYRVVNGLFGVVKVAGGVVAAGTAIAGILVSGGSLTVPAAVAITYGTNTATSGLADVWNAITGNVDDIGNVNVLNSLSEGLFGQVGEWLGDRETGESVGHAVYTIGEIANLFFSLDKLATKIKEAGSYAGTLGESASKGKEMISQATKELPEALKQIGNIDVGKVTTIPSQIAEITSSNPAISGVVSDIMLINEGVEKGAKMIDKSIEVVNTLGGSEVIKTPAGYDNAMDVNDTIGDTGGVLDVIKKIWGLKNEFKELDALLETPALWDV